MTARYQIIPTAQGGGAINLATKERVTRGSPGWADYQAALTAGEVLPAGPDATLEIQALKDQMVADIDAHAAALRNQAIAGHSMGEMAGWTIKLQDALAVQAGVASPYAALMPALCAALGIEAPHATICAALADLRGITEAEYAQKIIRDATATLIGEIAIDALRGARCDTVRSQTELGALLVFDWRAGWPNVTGI